MSVVLNHARVEEINDKVISESEVKSIIADAFKKTFEETGIDPREFSWFSNKPLNRL